MSIVEGHPFCVYQFFPNETWERVAEFVEIEVAMDTARRLTLSVGGRMGTTRRVIITDNGDDTVFEWKFGEGVTYPPGRATNIVVVNRRRTMTTITLTTEQTAIYDSGDEREAREMMQPIMAQARAAYASSGKPVTVETADGIVIDVVQ
jgi:hypothetical protein